MNALVLFAAVRRALRRARPQERQQDRVDRLADLSKPTLSEILRGDPGDPWPAVRDALGPPSARDDEPPADRYREIRIEPDRDQEQP